MAEPSDRGRDGTQRFGSYGLAATIARQKTKPQSFPASPYPPRARFSTPSQSQQRAPEEVIVENVRLQSIPPRAVDTHC